MRNDAFSASAQRCRAPRAPGTRQGTVVLLFALFLPVLLLLAAGAINVAYMHLVRTELSVATDAASRAGSRTMSLAQSPVEARQMAMDTATRNRVAGTPLTLATDDIVFGHNVRPEATSRWLFSPAALPEEANALRVIGRRTAGSPGNAIPLFLPGILGLEQFEPVKSGVAMQVDRDIVLIADRSGSMAQSETDPTNTVWEPGDPAPENSRWRRLVQAIDALLNTVATTPSTEKVSLASFAGTPATDRGLTTNYTDVRCALDTYTLAFPGGGSAIGDGMQAGLGLLQNTATARPLAQRTMVVVTDGRNRSGLDPRQAAACLHDEEGVVIHAVTYGSDADQTTMAQVAQLGGGRHWHARDGVELIAAFLEIATFTPTVITE